MDFNTILSIITIVIVVVIIVVFSILIAKYKTDLGTNDTNDEKRAASFNASLNVNASNIEKNASLIAANADAIKTLTSSPVKYIFDTNAKATVSVVKCYEGARTFAAKDGVVEIPITIFGFMNNEKAIISTKEFLTDISNIINDGTNGISISLFKIESTYGIFGCDYTKTSTETFDAKHLDDTVIAGTFDLYVPDTAALTNHTATYNITNMIPGTLVPTASTTKSDDGKIEHYKTYTFILNTDDGFKTIGKVNASKKMSVVSIALKDVVMKVGVDAAPVEEKKEEEKKDEKKDEKTDEEKKTDDNTSA